MDYWVKDEINCPECNESLIFYNDDCLNEYYRCTSCGIDFYNTYVKQNTLEYAKNSIPSDIPYYCDQNKIWINSKNAAQYLKCTINKVRYLLKQNLISGLKEKGKWNIDWITILNYQKKNLLISNGISVKEAAIKLKKSESTIRNYLVKEKIKGYKINNRWVVIL